MAEEIILLGFWVSPFSIRAKIALEEKGVDYEYREEEQIFDNKTPLLLSSNPIYKKTPVLIHNGKPLCESLIILQYIDEVWERSPRLLPDDPHLRAKARFWADFVDKKMLDSSNRVWRAKGETRLAAREELIGHLKMLEAELGEKQYFGDETFGYTDIALVAFASWLKVYEREGVFSMEEECPKLTAWVERCKERESVVRNIPNFDKVYDYVLYLRKRFGAQMGGDD